MELFHGLQIVLCESSFIKLFIALNTDNDMIADSSISQLIRAYIVANVITLFEIDIYSAFLGLTQNFNTHLHRRFNWAIEVGQGHKNWYQDRDNCGLISDFWISPHVAKPKDVVRFTGHDDVIKWKYFLRYWALDSPPKGQEPGALMFLWCSPEQTAE